MSPTPEQQAWIDSDPDPAARAELAGLGPGELAERFAAPLAFGTAGLRGPLRDQLGVRVAPAVHFELDRRSSMALLASGKGGAMLVWQRSN